MDNHNQPGGPNRLGSGVGSPETPIPPSKVSALYQGKDPERPIMNRKPSNCDNSAGRVSQWGKGWRIGCALGSGTCHFSGRKGHVFRARGKVGRIY